MKNYFLILLTFFLVSVTSCDKEKDKWKLPVDVAFKIDVNRTGSKGGNLIFTGGEIVLSKFEFDGKRIQGEDVYFSKSFDNGLIVPFDPSVGKAELDFDIPQGTYTKITIHFEADKENGDNSIVLEGSYTDSYGDTYPLLLELEEFEIYTVVAKDISGSSEIILEEGVPSVVKIMLDPVYWFQSVSTEMLDDAELVELDGVQTILIDDWTNEDIFDTVMDQIDKGTTVTFD